MNKKWAMKWAKALESGKYRKGREFLHKVDASYHHKYCCLGVLCELVGGCDVEKVDNNYYYDGAMGFLPVAVKQEVGMDSLGGYIDSLRRDLADINDNDRKGFKEIAAIIRKNWKEL